MLLTGCGRGDVAFDGGLADQVVSATCAVNNGGCSISPMVLCGTSVAGELLCAACPIGYVGDGRVCTSTSATDECALGTHNCSPYATCTDTLAAYTCACFRGFIGNGVRCQSGHCFDAGNPVRYRLSGLSIPTSAQAASGDVVGHNVDNIGDACGLMDFAGDVDNSLIGLATDLLALEPGPIDLQREIDVALNCSTSSVDCTAVDVFVSVQTGTECIVWEVENGEGETLAGPFAGYQDGLGNLGSRVPRLELTIPYDTGTATLDLALEFTNVILTGTVAGDSLTNLVVGGALTRTSLEAAVTQLIATLGGDLTFDDIEQLLTNRYDVQTGGQCSALSFGLTGEATLSTP